MGPEGNVVVVEVGYGARNFDQIELGAWAGLAYAREKYVGETADNTLPAFITIEYQYILWGALKRFDGTSRPHRGTPLATAVQRRLGGRSDPHGEQLR